MKILHIDSSITGAQSVSRQLSAAVVERLGGGGEHEVTYRDVAADKLPHFNAVTAPSAHPLSQAVPVLDAAQQAQRATSDAILAEFLDADLIVIGVPMYNFTVPSELKAWIDRVIVPGTTFRKGETGPEGLAGNKRVILAVARGGVYAAGSPFAPAEHAESLLRSLLGFIGVTEIETVVAEGLNFAEARNSAIASARDAARQLAA
ncbi:FMN-dependent NADH-azoreductase [Sphingomonas sp. BK580]|uniref:FMN-dependent NADH-azoreductase n=1 Tax=Sphingomonas sp. BK580 TaxID=2586972 RepID=UPI001616E34F|nr:NAD(P)H-dependent oxidoreductase [Sphingomonas sp. BK580]MBB3695584.1 FMN-dependent NADH-azoreductase [Sphingomonas sp. BK580]